ncbi:methionine-binding protein [Neisseria weixii]|uniref:Methionine-binding protein n=1 Tax=Neisseria weixii TaxID=1853276 RepID=A0A3N4MX85_9NEIS|nr:methionine-binding protein [Neisseria weixii]RPD84300.1 methionine-binding protein [Neisseria weixii]RPD85008.1 methionine-binding protein [Neisseria weixii]
MGVHLVKIKVLLVLLLSAGGCVYHETPYGRTAVIDLPTRSETVIHKTVNVNAPPGTTVIYQDSTPVGYPAGYPVYPRRYNRYD